MLVAAVLLVGVLHLNALRLSLVTSRLTSWECRIMFVCVCVCVYAHTHACMHACMYVCM